LVRVDAVLSNPTLTGAMGAPSHIATDLALVADERGLTYRTAEPYPHIVLDEVFHPEALAAVLEEWPGRDDAAWNIYDDGSYERGKFTSSDLAHFGPTTREVLAELNGPPFLEFLERLTGIAGLIPDPYFASAGLFEVTEEGFLTIHGDFSINQRTGLDRRCNVLIYLNHDWTDANGGQLELWRARPLRREHSIVPLFNRMVIFDTRPNAYHGHPNPVVAPPGATRKAISAYYFTRGRPLREQFYGAQSNRVAGSAPSRRAQIRAVGRALTPPILVEAARQLRRKVDHGGL